MDRNHHHYPVGLLLAVATIVLGWYVGLHGQAVGLLGRTVPTAVVVSTTGPCDVVSTCTAAYSFNRRVLAGYSGNLFQVSKSGPTTQNIGMVSGLVDTTTLNTFCGANNANSCRVHILYDQSGNANDLTCGKTGSIGGAPSSCTTFTDDIPLLFTGSWPSAMTLYIFGTNSCCFYLGNSSPTSTPTANGDTTIIVAGNDSTCITSSSWYCIDFGLYHATNVSDVDGTNFAATLRTNNQNVGEFRTWGADIESTIDELNYGPSGGHNVYSPTVDSFSNVGNFTGAMIYEHVSTNVTADFNIGQRTYVHTYSSANWGGATQPAQLRVEAGGDATPTPGNFYEGVIYATAKNTTDEQAVQSNMATFYSVPALPSCDANLAVNIIGYTTVSGAYGLRLLDKHYKGPLVAVFRTSDSTFKPIGVAAGTCDIDTTTLNSFCNATTCRVYELWNQVISLVGVQKPFATGTSDTTLFFWGASGGDQSNPTSAAPTIVLNCLGSLPCMQFTGSSTQAMTLRPGDNQPVTRPYTVLAFANQTSGTFAAMFADQGTGNFYIGGGSVANRLALFTDASSNEEITGVAAGSWHAVAGMVPNNTTSIACGDGTCGTNSSATTHDIASAQWIAGINNGSSNPLTGKITEFIFTNGTAITTTQANTIHTEQCTYWGAGC